MAVLIPAACDRRSQPDGLPDYRRILRIDREELIADLIPGIIELIEAPAIDRIQLALIGNRESDEVLCVAIIEIRIVIIIYIR
jgi:hypothetical protein